MQGGGRNGYFTWSQIAGDKPARQTTMSKHHLNRTGCVSLQMEMTYIILLLILILNNTDTY